MALQRDLGTFEHHVRSAVAAHRVDRNRNGVAHRTRPSPRASWSGRLRTCRDHLAAVVVPARFAEMMWALQLSAIGALRIGSWSERMMRASHIAARRRRLLFRNGHDKFAFAKSDTDERR